MNENCSGKSDSMKPVLTLFILIVWHSFAIAQDLPNPSANIQTMPQDSYIIAMDNTWQATTGTNPSYRNFNLKAYGLIVHLLNNNIKVRRVIRAGKQKDDVDFSVSCRQIKPTSETNPAVRDFKAGPYVIFGPDILRVNIDQLIDAYNNNANGISGITNDTAKVRVYKTVADVDVDVRYDLTNFKPKAAILTDGGNAAVHLLYMTLAGIPATNYTTGTNYDLTGNCYTFASEPHNDNQIASVVNNIKNFVLTGGNFLAQCVTIPIYESLGKFQSSSGITVTNTNPAAVYYPNSDLSMGQFEGTFNINKGGSCNNWKYGASSFTNNAYAVAASTNGFVNNNSLIGASASKLISSSSPGGMIYYLGNHSYSRIDNYNDINGMRMYLNAMLTPSNYQNILRYSYAADCNAGAMKVSAYNGPSAAYPVTFTLYQDNGPISGAIDPGDAYIGATTVFTPSTPAFISLRGSDPNGDFVMSVQPSASCYKAEEVSPSPCRLITLSASLRNFTATVSGKQVLLRWQTFTEQGNEGFYVQRLMNNEWHDVSFVPSSAQGGNSNAKLQYQFVDEASFKGAAQYRIRMQGYDKTVHFSDIRNVVINEATTFSAYPNPSSTGHVTLFFPDAAMRSISLFDIAGRVVESFDGVTDYSFEIPKINRGVYVVKVTEASSGKVQTQKLVVNPTMP